MNIQTFLDPNIVKVVPKTNLIVVNRQDAVGHITTSNDDSLKTTALFPLKF